MPVIERKARRYGIPLSLAHALIGQESGGDPTAVSPKGATGLTQVMPGTAAGMYGISEQQAARKLRNPSFALDAGFRYLAAQKKTFGSWRLALAAYNAGPNAVREYGGVPPYEETENYVQSILGKAGDMSAAPTPTPMPTSVPSPSSAASASAPSSFDPRAFALSNLQQIAAGGGPNPVTALNELAYAKTTAEPTPPAPTSAAPQPAGVGHGALALADVKVRGPVTPRVRNAIELAQSYLGTPYVWGGEKPGGFDCSGLLQYVWAQAGVQIPRTTYDQFSAGQPVTKRGLRPGDALFFRGADPRGDLPGHVGIYIGGGRMIEAPGTGKQVRISSIRGRSDFAGARRYA